MIYKIKKIAKNILKNIVVILLLLTFILPYYSNAAINNDEEEEKGRGDVPTAAGKVLEGITTVKDASASSNIGTVSTNYPETGDGYESLTKINGRQYKNYKQYKGSYANNSYWNGTITNSGCGPTSIAIIASGYGIDKTPADICNLIKEKHGNYTGSATLSLALDDIGVAHETRSGDSTSTQIANIKANLEKGNPVAVGINGGTGYSPGGHWMAALGMDGDQIVISNPGNGNEAVKENLEEFVTRCMKGCSYILITQSLKTTTSSSGKGSDTAHDLSTEGYTNIHKSSITGREFKEYKQSNAPWSSDEYCNNKHFGGGMTIGGHACPLVADAILCSGYGADITPRELNKKYWSGYTVGQEIASVTNCSNNNVRFTNADAINHLKKGGTLIVHSFSQPFTYSEHWMSIIDVSSDGSEVYLSNPNSGGPNGWMNATSTLNAMVTVMYIPAEGGKSGSNSGITSLDNFLFIGDSRTVGLDSYIKKEGNNINVQGAGATSPYYWTKWIDDESHVNPFASSQIIKLPPKDQVKGISIDLGVNDPTQIDYMKTVLNKLLERYPNTPIFVNRVFYVSNSFTAYNSVFSSPSHMNSLIDKFNQAMQEFCSTNSNLYYIDATEGLHENGALSSKYSLDGIHLAWGTGGYELQAKNIKNAILNSSATNGSTNYSMNNLTSNISQYIKPNGRGGYKIDIDLDEKVEEMITLLNEGNNKDIDDFLKTSKKKEYLKAMLKAELITQFPDLRSASEISASATDEINIKSIKENLPDIIDKLELIKVSSVVSTEEQIDFKVFETEEELNAEIAERFKDYNGEYKQDGEKIIYTYTQQEKTFKLEIIGTSYSLYEIIDNGDTSAVEEYVFNRLKNKTVQEKIRIIISSNSVTKESIKDQFYTSLNNVSESRGYDIDQMVSLYYSYIYKIMNELTSQNNNLSDWLRSRNNSTPEDELQGVIRIKRKSINITTNQEEEPLYLSYIPYDEFTQKCNDEDKSVLDNFTIDSNGGIIVAQWKMTRNQPGGATFTSSENNLNDRYRELMAYSISYEITQSSPISYLSQIYQHTMPFDLLWTLLVYGGDYDFIYDLTNLINDTDITITALDKISESSQTYTKTINVSNKRNDSAVTSQGTSSTEEISDETVTIRYTIYTTTCTTELKVSYINSWIATYINNDEKLNDPKTEESEQKLESTDEETDWEQVSTEDLSDDEAFKIILVNNIKQSIIDYKNSNISSIILARAKRIIANNEEVINAYIDYLKSKNVIVFPSDKLKGITRDTTYELTQLDNNTKNKINNVTENILERTRQQVRDAIEKILIGIYEDVDWNPQITSGITTNQTKIDKVETNVETSITTYSYTTTSGQVIEKTDKYATEDNFITLLNKNGKAKGSLRSIAEWMFESIEKNRVLCDKLDLMKYLLGIAFGRDYDVDEDFNFNMFDPKNYSTTSSLGEFAGGTTEEKVWYALRKAGFSEYATAGAMGNIYGESGFDSSIVEYGNGIGFGLCQWSFGRRTSLEKYAASKGKDSSDIDIQIEYLLAELTPGGGCDGYASYQLVTYNGYSADDWINATSPSNAAVAFCWSFERPGGYSSVRSNKAEEYYKTYHGRDLSSFESSSSSNIGKYSSKLTGTAKKIVEAAESKIGCKYVYGAPLGSETEFDCGSFTLYCYAKAGIAIERTTQYSQAERKGKVYPINEAKPGDILHKEGHVGICVSNNNGKITYIHAANKELGVCESNGAQFTSALRLWE